MIRTNRVEIPQTLEEACDPSRTALIVYDMQVGILRQLKDGATVTAKVVQVLRAAREAGIRVFFTRHLSLPKQLLGTFQLRMAMAWQRVSSVDDVRPWFLRDSPVAMEIGIEPTVRHGADLAYIPIVVTDACGAGHREAADRALATLRFIGDALFATTEEICKTILRQR